jgi:DNA adenine methylase
MRRVNPIETHSAYQGNVSGGYTHIGCRGGPRFGERTGDFDKRIWRTARPPLTVLSRRCLLEERTPLAFEDGKQQTGGAPHGPSFLRWAGSKRKSLPQLAKAYQKDNRVYVEPFAGSAALFFFLKPQSAVLADANRHLVNALTMIKINPVETYEALARIRRDKDTYYQVRSRFNSFNSSSIDAAADFIYLNRNCFNGLWRTNQRGQFNVPYGGLEMGSHPPLSLFKNCSESLNNACVRHQDFRKTISEAGPNTFLFCDPPYFTAKERTFIEYGEKSFGQADLDDLLKNLVSADDRGVHIALTYTSTMPLSVPEHWTATSFAVTRNVGGFSGSRKTYGEVLYMNYSQAASK